MENFIPITVCPLRTGCGWGALRGRHFAAFVLRIYRSSFAARLRIIILFLKINLRNIEKRRERRNEKKNVKRRGKSHLVRGGGEIYSSECSGVSGGTRERNRSR